MMNLAKIVKDKSNNLYLKVYDNKIKVLAFFRIENYGRKLSDKLEDLSDVFSVNLKGGK